MHAQVYTAEQKKLFVLHLLGSEANKNSKNDTLKIWYLPHSIACYEDFMVELQSNDTEKFKK